MDERILVPLDGSKVGEGILPFLKELLANLSPKQKIEVTLFQVVPSLTYWVAAGEAAAPVPYTERELELIKQKAREYLEKIGEGLRSKGAVVKIMVSTGNPAREITKTADELRVDLVAMSTHGRSGLSRLAFRSVTDKVLRAIHVPVLMIRAPKETAPRKRYQI